MRHDAGPEGCRSAGRNCASAAAALGGEWPERVPAAETRERGRRCRGVHHVVAKRCDGAEERKLGEGVVLVRYVGGLDDVSAWLNQQFCLKE